MEPTEAPRLVQKNWPDTWPGVVGYFLVHPRTWCLLIALAVSWKCFGLKEFYYRHHGAIIESEAAASTSHH